MADPLNPFDLPGNDPFADPSGGAGGPPVQASATPTPGGPQEPKFVTESQYNEVKTELERLKPLENLRVIGEALNDPGIRNRVMGVLYGTAGDYPTQGGPAAPAIDTQVASVREKYAAQKKAALEAGDMMTFGALCSDEGAEIGRMQSAADLQRAAAPVLSMTANSAVESWIMNKRSSSALFAKVEDKFRALVAQTPPAKMAELAQSGLLTSALETGYQKIVTDIQESAYNRAAAEGKLNTTRPTPPPYGMAGAGGGMPPPDTPDEDDKDDTKFQQFMEERGVKFTVDKSGAIIGEAS